MEAALFRNAGASLRKRNSAHVEPFLHADGGCRAPGPGDRQGKRDIPAEAFTFAEPTTVDSPLTGLKQAALQMLEILPVARVLVNRASTYIRLASTNPLGAG